ncbi:unnamed protein product [Adineta ricciae]|uniref:NAD(P)(+)--arginine ADP-ribosyltransferase n=1 Tax=Adineta ricciae TaxID=249248 RepID=A0A815R061_ADIRI|nr:unnamed protein product [Adineta ricciae]CAF1497019.1 unnamed protein product [Adineta ricciae]
MATSIIHHVDLKSDLSNSRYTDIKEEPIDKLLMPIDGYQDEPLVPLEESVSPVTHLFTNLAQYIWIAKRNCQKPLDDLTQDESAAIYLYTMQFPRDQSLYLILNRFLRTENRDALTPWFKYLKLFLTALFKLQSVRATVWRGVRGEDLSDQYPTGHEFAWWGITSCTATPDVLEKTSFLGKTGVRTLFSIECLNGKSIKQHSYFSKTEEEIVLLPGTFFKVVGQVNPAEGLHIIHLKEIQPPFVLLKPPFDGSEQVKSSLDLHKLKKASRLCIVNESCISPLAASDQSLLCCSSESLTLMNVQGQSLFTVKRSFAILDVCWSSCLRQFLILSDTNALYSLSDQTRKLSKIVVFNRNNVRSCTCNTRTLMVSNYDHKSFIDVYDLKSSYKLIESYELPVMGKSNQYVEMIRLSETYLGIMLNQFSNKRNWFELRNTDDFSVLHSIDLEYNDYIHRLIVVPNDEFLMHVHGGKELMMLTKNGIAKLDVHPNSAKKGIMSIAFVGTEKCFIISTNEPSELHFYSL